MDEALEEGIEHLNWRNHSIASFIKKTTSYIADATNLLELLKTNVRRICEMLQVRGVKFSVGACEMAWPRKCTLNTGADVLAYRS